MPAHEAFEQLCALSATGDLTVDEFRRLQEHLHECPSCRACYNDFYSIVGEGLPVLQQGQAVRWGLGGRGRKKRFLQRAREEGMPVVEPGRRPVRQWWMLLPAGAAATVLLVVWPAYRSASERHRQAESRIAVLSTKVAELERLVAGKREPSPPPVASQPAPPPAALAGPSERERELTRQLVALNDKHEAALEDKGRLEEQVRALSGDLEQLRRESGSARADAQRLEGSLQEAKLSLARANQDLESLRSARSADAITIAEQRGRLDQLAARVRERSEILDRERELLAAARDVRDLMGARDMRIAEVADAGGPRRRGISGRVFYSREKLIYYAFDLDKRGDIQKVAFQVWGKREGRSQPPRSLGFLSLDDAGAKRWVLRNEDPALLAQIDHVFVTVEPPGGASQPTSRGILFANLVQP